MDISKLKVISAMQQRKMHKLGSTPWKVLKMVFGRSNSTTLSHCALGCEIATEHVFLQPCYGSYCPTR